MVKPTFQNVAVDLWVHSGKLGATESSICLFHEEQTAGSPILAALAELSAMARPAQRVITCRSCPRPFALQALKLKLADTRDELKVMQIAHDQQTATIDLTSIGLSLLQDSVAQWLNGREDFGVSPRHAALKPKELGKLDHESLELWFWGPEYASP